MIDRSSNAQCFFSVIYGYNHGDFSPLLIITVTSKVRLTKKRSRLNEERVINLHHTSTLHDKNVRGYDMKVRDIKRNDRAAHNKSTLAQ